MSGDMHDRLLWIAQGLRLRETIKQIFQKEVIAIVLFTNNVQKSNFSPQGLHSQFRMLMPSQETIPYLVGAGTTLPMRETQNLGLTAEGIIRLHSHRGEHRLDLRMITQDLEIQ
jgi:hypothetical protein